MEIGPNEPLPDHWKSSVVKVLETGRTNITIGWQPSAAIDWSVYGYQMEVYPSLIAALRQKSIEGRIWYNLSQKGAQTYDFLLNHPGVCFPFYCKITLKADKIQIRILSMHKAEKSAL